jgi:sodium/hydrogen antiporter
MEHGLDTEVIVAFTLTVVAWSMISARLERVSLTPAIVFVVVGMLVANPPLSLVELTPGTEAVRVLAEITLAVVLFTDAARIDLRTLRSGAGVPIRLLGVGLPLTVAAGVVVGLAVFDGMGIWVCAVIAAAVAPTDAALGAPIMGDERIPGSVRQTLNVESGLNDGLITPLVTFVIAGAVAEFGNRPELSIPGAAADLVIGAAVGVVVGVASGLALAFAQRRSWMVAGAAPLYTLALSLLSYSVAVQFDANGFVAAFVAGLAFGSAYRRVAEVLEFAAEAGEMLASGVWFVFGVVSLSVLGDATWQVAVFAVLALTVARLVPVGVALLGSGLDRWTVAFIGWFGPRGLASVVFGLIAYDALVGEPAQETVLAAVVATVLLSVVAHGLTARPLAGRYASALSAHAVSPEPPVSMPRRSLGQHRAGPSAPSDGPRG